MVNRHSDIKASNILSEIEDESILAAFEAAEAESPSVKVIRPDRKHLPKAWSSEDIRTTCSR